MSYSVANAAPASSASPGVEAESARSIASRPLALSKSTDSFEKLRSNASVTHIESRRSIPQVQKSQRQRSRRRSGAWQLTGKELHACKGSTKQHSELVIQLTKKSLALSAVLLRQEINPLRSRFTRPERFNVAPPLPHTANLVIRLKPENSPILSEHPAREKFMGSTQSNAPSTQSKDSLQTIPSHSSEAQDGEEWKSQRILLQKELERLYFWSSNFSDEELEIILGEQGDLKNSILETLSSIGQSLIDALQPEPDIDPRLRQPARDLDKLVRKCKSLKVESYDGDDTASETSDMSSGSASDGEQSPSLLDKLRADINRLQVHVRVMRRVLDFAESSGVGEGSLSPKRVRFEESDARPPSPPDEKKRYTESSIDSFVLSNRSATEYVGIKHTASDTTRGRQPVGTVGPPRAKSLISMDSPRLPLSHDVLDVIDGASKRKRLTPSSGRPCIRCSEKERPCDGGDSCTPCLIACVLCIREAKDISLQLRPDNHQTTKENQSIPLDKLKIASLQEILGRLGTLPNMAKLTSDAGKRIMLRAFTYPVNFQALEPGCQSDALGSNLLQPRCNVVDALDMICKDLNTKLRIDDIGLPADVTNQFLALVSELPPFSPNRDVSGNKKLEKSPLLHILRPMISILALLECLPDWTIHMAANDLALARLVLFFAFGCFTKQLLDMSGKLSKEILRLMMNKVGHKEEVRYAIGNYYVCIEHLSRVGAGIKLNEIWEGLQPRPQEVLSILRCLFNETRETLRSRKSPGTPHSILRSSSKKKQVRSSSPHAPDMLDSEMDLSTFIVEFVPEIPVLPPFHLACSLSDKDDKDQSNLSSGASEPSRPLGDLKPVSARYLLTEVTSEVKATSMKVAQKKGRLKARDVSLRDGITTPPRASPKPKATTTQDLAMTEQISPTNTSHEIPITFHDYSYRSSEEITEPPADEYTANLSALLPVSREITMHSPLPLQPLSTTDVPDGIEDLDVERP